MISFCEKNFLPMADKLAKEALAEAASRQKFTDKALPGEDFTVKVGGHKMSSSV